MNQRNGQVGNRAQQQRRANQQRNRVVSSGVPKMTDAQRIEQRNQRRKAALRAKKKKKMRFWVKTTRRILYLAIIIIIWLLFFNKSPIEKGTAQLKEGEYESAIEEFSQGLNNLEYLAESYQGLGLANYELGNHEEVVKSLELSIQKGINNSGVLYNILSLSYIELGDYDNALKSIVLGIEQLGNSDELEKQLRFNEVLCMEKTGDWQGAKAKATSYLQSYPDDTDMQQEIKFLETR